MTKFSQCFCLNLTNSFTRDSKDLSDFFKRARTAIVKPKTETQNVFFPIGQRIKHAFDLLFKQLVCGMVCRTRGCMIFNEIAKIPHGSKNEKRLSDWIVDFAKAHGLRYVQGRHVQRRDL